MNFRVSVFLTIAAGALFILAEPAKPTVAHQNTESGGHLLTEEPIPSEPIEEVAQLLKIEPPKPGEIAGDDVQVPEIPEKFLAAYFAERPKGFLIDPQGLLSPTDFRDRLGFLNYHASDSSIDLFVYVIGGDQAIPGEIRDEELIERFFSAGRPAAVIYYYLGVPQRSKLYLSPALTDSISVGEQRRALESSVMQAIEKTKASEQFERFLTQMSIRIYWMERMLAGEGVGNEVAATGAPPVATAGKPSAKLLMVQDLARKFAFPAAVTAAALLIAFGIGFWLRLRARYRFPEFDVEPRLGGTHAAGIGAVISFASAAVPPASQRDQVPEYLRRA